MNIFIAFIKAKADPGTQAVADSLKSASVLSFPHVLSGNL
jgi:hypothetical protein